ncbi:MAG TPA: DapH/DapD/GlmU-related protein, partial [Candidatus Dormibacteraeota bacterium]
MTIHPTADVAESADIGRGTRVWHQAQVRERAHVGEECILGKGSYVDFEVRIGDRCKLQNGVFVYHGFDLESGVFLGPGAMLLNDKNPRAVNPDGSLKSDADWTVSKGVIRQGASIGGGAVVLPGVTIGRFALVGSGAVV